MNKFRANNRKNTESYGSNALESPSWAYDLRLVSVRGKSEEWSEKKYILVGKSVL